jgi:hypothetical protein
MRKIQGLIILAQIWLFSLLVAQAKRYDAYCATLLLKMAVCYFVVIRPGKIFVI